MWMAWPLSCLSLLTGEEGAYNIFLQNADGLVESIPVSNGGGRRYALLPRAPRVPIVIQGTTRPSTSSRTLQIGVVPGRFL